MRQKIKIDMEIMDFEDMPAYFLNKRNGMGVSQKYVADKAGISQVTLHRIESGNLPGVNTMLAVAGALGLKLKLASECG